MAPKLSEVWNLIKGSRAKEITPTNNPAFPTEPPDVPEKPSKGGLPVGRISVDDQWPSVLSNLGQNLYSFVMPKRWPLEIYDLITDLSLNVPDLRQAVNHVVTLGNTGHLIRMAGDSDTVVEKAVERIRERSQVMFPWSAGSDGMINNMFGQVARVGALSMEWVPREDLKGIDKVFFVPVSEIRWVPRKDMMGYYPVQIPKNLMSWVEGMRSFMVVLNPRTYFYANVEQIDACPYAIPPLISALEPVAMQRDMIRSIRKVMKKLGVMGLISYAVEPPSKRPGESEDGYHSRCKAYLQTITDQMKDGFNEGIATGFKGAFEFDVTGVSGDAKGVAEMFKQNEEQLFSAIDADPAMHGRTYSTTETYASVVYSKMISKLANTQRMVASSLEFGWNLDFLLAGLPADVQFEFKASQALSNLQEAQSEMVEIANAEALYQGGVIDQQQKANRLGYAVPAEKEPLPDPAIAQDPNISQRTGGKSDNTPSSKTTKRKQAKTAKHSVQFEFNRAMNKYYHVPESLGEIRTGAIATLKKEHNEQDPLLDPHARGYL